MTEPVVATRVTAPQARRAFAAGRTILVSERGHEAAIVVGPSTTTWNNAETTWKWLSDMVDMFSNRYPNQRYYLLPAAVVTK